MINWLIIKLGTLCIIAIFSGLAWLTFKARARFFRPKGLFHKAGTLLGVFFGFKAFWYALTFFAIVSL